MHNLGAEIPNIHELTPENIETENTAALNVGRVALGPESLHWRLLDWRIGLTALSTGLVHLMEPAIGAGVKDHSRIFEDLWGRTFGSASLILDSVFSQNPDAVGCKIRDIHKNFKGSDESGQRYHALNPETFWRAHAMFDRIMVGGVADRFDYHNLSYPEREQAYGESVTWYRRYNLSTRPVPPTHHAFCEKWDNEIVPSLKMTPAAEQAIGMALDRKIDRLPFIPKFMWRIIGLPANDFVRVTAIGGIPENIRDRFDIPWSEADDFKLKSTEKAVKQAWQHLERFDPLNLRYHPVARAGIAQAARSRRHPADPYRVAEIAA